MRECFGNWNSQAECRWCTAKEDCKAKTRARLESWRKTIDNPKREETHRERERRLNEAGMKRWAMRDKLKG